MRIFLTIPLVALATGAAADEVGVPAGCEVTATLVKPDCEMHQVLACDGAADTRVDVYKDGTFLGEDTYAAMTRVRWRRGKLFQELELIDGSLEFVPSMPEGETVTLETRRVRKQLGSDAAPMLMDFTYEIAVDGPAIRDLPGGGDREVRRYHVVTRSPGEESSDLLVDYDPALGLPIWTEGRVLAHDGSPHDVSLGTVAVLMPGDPGYMSDTAPEGAACTPD